MARNVPTELIIVDAVTRRPVIDFDPLTVPTFGSWWVRSDAPGLVPFVRAARRMMADTGLKFDIVWSGNTTRSFESACDHHEFAPLINMVPVGDTLTAPTVCPVCAAR